MLKPLHENGRVDTHAGGSDCCDKRGRRAFHGNRACGGKSALVHGVKPPNAVVSRPMDEEEVRGVVDGGDKVKFGRVTGAEYERRRELVLAVHSAAYASWADNASGKCGEAA